MAWNVEKLTSLPRGLVLLVAISVLGLGSAFGARPAQASGGVLVGSVTAFANSRRGQHPYRHRLSRALGAAPAFRELRDRRHPLQLRSRRR